MRRTVSYRVVAGLIAAAVVLAAALALVINLRAAPGGSLAGSAWRLTTMNDHPALAGSNQISLDFQDAQRAGGNSGCNIYGGDIAISGGSLTVSGLVSTKRACTDDGLNTQEAEYLRALASVAAYERAGDQLTLKDASGAVVLVFTAA